MRYPPDSLPRNGEGNDNKASINEKRFEVICMKESDTIDSFFTLLIGLVTQMRSHGETIEEIRIVEKVLRSLP